MSDRYCNKCGTMEMLVDLLLKMTPTSELAEALRIANSKGCSASIAAFSKELSNRGTEAFAPALGSSVRSTTYKQSEEK